MARQNMIDDKLEGPWLEELQRPNKQHLDNRYRKDPTIGPESFADLPRQAQ